MRIFISWSGELSQTVAMSLRNWLKNVIQVVEPYVSSEDIEKGSRWFVEIGKHLEEAQVGIVCLTRENMHKPWVLFESGAISQSIERSRVTPLLIDLSPADLSGPLAQFQATTITEPEMLRLVKGIGAQLTDDRFTPSLIESAFQKWWPDFRNEVHEAIRLTGIGQKQPSVRSDRALLEELLETTRSIAQHVSRSREDADFSPLAARGSTFDDQIQFAEIIGGLEKRKKKLLIAALQGAKSARFSDDTLIIEFDQEARHSRDTLAKPDNAVVLREVLQEVLGRPAGIQFHITRKLF
jgi:hypothetical protein